MPNFNFYPFEGASWKKFNTSSPKMFYGKMLPFNQVKFELHYKDELFFRIDRINDKWAIMDSNLKVIDCYDSFDIARKYCERSLKLTILHPDEDIHK